MISMNPEKKKGISKLRTDGVYIQFGSSNCFNTYNMSSNSDCWYNIARIYDYNNFYLFGSYYNPLYSKDGFDNTRVFKNIKIDNCKNNYCMNDYSYKYYMKLKDYLDFDDISDPLHMATVIFNLSKNKLDNTNLGESFGLWDLITPLQEIQGYDINSEVIVKYDVDDTDIGYICSSMVNDDTYITKGVNDFEFFIDKYIDENSKIYPFVFVPYNFSDVGNWKDYYNQWIKIKLK